MNKNQPLIHLWNLILNGRDKTAKPELDLVVLLPEQPVSAAYPSSVTRWWSPSAFSEQQSDKERLLASTNLAVKLFLPE